MQNTIQELKVQDLHYQNDLNPEFFKTLKSRVNKYFKERNIQRQGDWRMWIKTAFMLTLYFTPLYFIAFGNITSVWANLGLWILQGFGMAGIGLSIMHDANHGAYSKNQTVNTIVGHVLNVVGACAVNWKIQHNVLHHSYTNVHGVDEDISHGDIVRFSPTQEWQKHHRFQFIYAWFLYGLMTISWVTLKDFKRLNKYREQGLLEPQGRTYGGVLTEIIISKVLYYAYALALPIYLSPLAWWQTTLMFVLMHFVAGLILGMIFQPAHVMETSEFPVPDKTGTIENNWAISQLCTTTNFATNSRLFSWYVGGLNFQIEHHLFPSISHIHYKKLSKIVEQTAHEFGLPYHKHSTFAKAIWLHGKMLYSLGKN